MTNPPRHSAELFALPGCDLPESPEPNAAVMGELARLMEMAARGELVGLAVAAILVDGATQTQIVCEECYLYRCVATTALVHRYAVDRLADTSRIEGEERK